MSLDITLAEYFGAYAAHPDATPLRKASASALLRAVNDLYARAAQDGCELPDNPATGSGVSGNGHGGFRPQDCQVGALDSTHKTGHAVDRYDPRREFAAWCLAHPQELTKRGLHMEDPRWTVTVDKYGAVVSGWVHLQDIPPRSGRLVYIPSEAPALAKAPAAWETFA